MKYQIIISNGPKMLEKAVNDFMAMKEPEIWRAAGGLVICRPTDYHKEHIVPNDELLTIWAQAVEKQ